MTGEILTIENAEKIANYEKLKNERNYYKSELENIKIIIRTKNEEIRKLKKKITELERKGE